MPIVLNSKVFRLLMAEEDGDALLGIWYALVMVAAQAPRELRGYLADDTGPLDVEDLAVLTGLDATKIARAIEIFSGPKIRWLGKVAWPPASDAGDQASAAAEVPSVPADSPRAVGESPATVAAPRPGPPGHRSLPVPEPNRTEPDLTEPDLTRPEPNRTRPHRSRPEPNPNRTGTKPEANRKRTGTKPGPGPDRTAPDRTLPDQTEPDPDQIGAPAGPAGELGSGRRCRERPAQGAAPGSSRAADDRFRQLFVRRLGVAFALAPTRLLAQQQAFTAVAVRIQGRLDRDIVAEELIGLAEEKRDAGLNNPMAAWQSDVNREYPANGPPRRPPQRRGARRKD